MENATNPQNDNMFKFYLTILIGLILFIVVDQIRLHYKDVKLDEIKANQQIMVETQLNKNIHLLNDSYKDNLKYFEHRDSIRISQVNQLIKANQKLDFQINYQTQKSKTIQYKIDSIDKDLFLPNPYLK